MNSNSKSFEAIGANIKFILHNGDYYHKQIGGSYLGTLTVDINEHGGTLTLNGKETMASDAKGAWRGLLAFTKKDKDRRKTITFDYTNEELNNKEKVIRYYVDTRYPGFEEKYIIECYNLGNRKGCWFIVFDKEESHTVAKMLNREYLEVYTENGVEKRSY